MVLGNEEQRIVAEAAGAAPLTDDDAETAALDDRPHLSVRVRQRRRANVIGGPFLVGQRRQLGEKAVVVGLVVALLAGVARRVHARPALQRQDHEAAVFGQHPLAHRLGRLARFLAGVGLERGAVLDYLERLRIGAQVLQLQPEVAEDLDDFLSLLLVARAQH